MVLAGDVEDGLLNKMWMPLSGVVCSGSEDAKERKELLLSGLDVEELEEALLQDRLLPGGAGNKDSVAERF